MNVELKSISFDKSCQRKCDALIILLPKGTSVASSSSALTQWVAAAQKQGALGPNGAGSVWDGGAAKGATGRPVPLLVHHVLSAGSSVSKRA